MPEDTASRGKVYVVILNWNGWRDTLECLESVFRSTYRDFQVVVCDNASQDGSLERIKAWAQGQQPATVATHPSIRPLTTPPIPKPMRVAEYCRAAAEQGGDEGADSARLVLIQTGANLGFAGGNNVGLRFALARGNFEYAWLLNNDTVVAGDALSGLVRRLDQRPRAGLCSPTLLYYHAPERVQVRGGTAYDRWFATMRHLGQGESVEEAVDAEAIERSISYPAGASVLVRRSFLERVGLLSESYFLYYEELDWVTRAGGLFEIAYSPDSTVYHKEGSSIASAGADSAFHTADFYAHRNRLRYTRHFFPAGLPTTLLRTMAAVLARLWRGQPRRAWGILRLMMEGDTYRFPDRDPGRIKHAPRTG
ncbi:MAG TPA: glycosyltransferase family 2 protein [Gemmatimonadales bacterium]|nr:glycosyltransferase family 2 protein [Gemmatimonadales bacterium]